VSHCACGSQALLRGGIFCDSQSPPTRGLHASSVTETAWSFDMSTTVMFSTSLLFRSVFSLSLSLALSLSANLFPSPLACACPLLVSSSPSFPSTLPFPCMPLASSVPPPLALQPMRHTVNGNKFASENAIVRNEPLSVSRNWQMFFHQPYIKQSWCLPELLRHLQGLKGHHLKS